MENLVFVTSTDSKGNTVVKSVYSDATNYTDFLVDKRDQIGE